MSFHQIADLTLNEKCSPTMEAEAGGLNPIWINMHSGRHSEVNGDQCLELGLSLSPQDQAIVPL